MHRLDLGLNYHPRVLRNGVNTLVKIPSTGRLRGGSNPRRCITQDIEPNTLPTALLRPRVSWLTDNDNNDQDRIQRRKWRFSTISSLRRCLQHIGLRSRGRFVCFVGCLTSQQHASVSQGRICTDNFTCCHTEIEATDQTFHLTQSQYTDTGPTSPSTDPITPGAWQGSHWSANV